MTLLLMYDPIRVTDGQSLQSCNHCFQPPEVQIMCCSANCLFSQGATGIPGFPGQEGEPGPKGEKVTNTSFVVMKPGPGCG